MKAAIANPAVFAGLLAGLATIVFSAGFLRRTGPCAKPSGQIMKKINNNANSVDMKTNKRCNGVYSGRTLTAWRTQQAFIAWWQRLYSLHVENHLAGVLLDKIQLQGLVIALPVVKLCVVELAIVSKMACHAICQPRFAFFVFEISVQNKRMISKTNEVSNLVIRI